MMLNMENENRFQYYVYNILIDILPNSMVPHSLFKTNGKYYLTFELRNKKIIYSKNKYTITEAINILTEFEFNNKE